MISSEFFLNKMTGGTRQEGDASAGTEGLHPDNEHSNPIQKESIPQLTFIPFSEFPWTPQPVIYYPPIYDSFPDYKFSCIKL